MNVQSTQLSELTIGDPYNVKFATLQRVPIFITVTDVTGEIATVQYRALPDDPDPYDEKTFPVNTTVFVVS